MDCNSQPHNSKPVSFIFDDLSSHQWNNKTEGCFSNCNLFGGVNGVKSTLNRDNGAADGPGDCKDKDAVENFLAESMNKLSIEEREKAVAEVYGIAGKKDYIDENSAFMDAIIKRLETHLLLIKRGTSYERAEKLNKVYVTNRSFRVLFLRAHQYDPKPAAERLIRFFELKEELFGIEKTVREILIEDLDQLDIRSLESGCCQVLPQPDKANRRVLLMIPGLRGTIPVEHHMRAHFYTMMTTLRESEEARTNGIVGVMYAVGAFGDASAGIDASRVAKLTYSLPIPFSGLHFCHSDIRHFVMIKAVIPFLPLHKIPMFRSHYGTHSEIVYALRAYGISEGTLAFSHFDGGFMYQQHNMWYQDRKEKDARIAMERRALVLADFPLGPFDNLEGEDPFTSAQMEYKCNVDAESATESRKALEDGKLSPRSQDVLFGYGYKLHPGNAELHKLIDQHAEEYAATKGKREKMDYALNLVRHMKNQGSRFLIFERESKGWVEVPDNQARNKVAKTIRNRRRK